MPIKRLNVIRFLLAPIICMASLPNWGQSTTIKPSEKHPMLSLGKAKAQLTNPDPAHWHPFQISDKPKPGVVAYGLMRDPIKDSRGIEVKPVMSAMILAFGEEGISAYEFARRQLDNTGLNGLQRGLRGNTLIARGTVEYGGYTHHILSAFQVQGAHGLQVMCDSTDTVLGAVEDDFWAWLNNATFDPYASAPADFNPGPLPTNGETSFQEIYGGYRGVITDGPASVSAQFFGPSFRVATTEDGSQSVNPSFWIGPLLVQWFLLEDAQFLKGVETSARKRAETHFLWETNFIKESFKSQNLPPPVISEQAFTECRSFDGTSRAFYSWKMRLGEIGKEGTQFILTTPNPKGLVVLTIVVPKAEDEPAARALMDSYRFTVGPISPAYWAEIQYQRRGKK
ncbi:MAG TPA: hypothetical protein VJ505_04160 [Holophagaceae bacterium]|nr:hypothetical protein [Holophagaceae bacterium]